MKSPDVIIEYNYGYTGETKSARILRIRETFTYIESPQSERKYAGIRILAFRVCEEH
jgi:hypothetical protein